MNQPPTPPRTADHVSSAVQLLGPKEIRDLARTVGVVPTKKRGQNFVVDPNTVRRIVATAELSPDDHVLEVGPGLGSLTLGLLDVVSKVTAVEIDTTLAEQLPRTVAEYAPTRTENLRVICSDALALTGSAVEDLGANPPTAFVANLPYNVAVPILLHVLEIFPTITRVLVMVQAEVADRLAAEPGNRVYGVPSVKARFYGQVQRAGAIGKNVFWPAPNVDSGLVKLTRGTRPWPIDSAARAQLWPIIDAAFAQRRKTLRAALKGHYGNAAAAENALREAGIDPQRRGETLSIDEFISLTQLPAGTETPH
ncbi:16S rRNA (adenine(1518)-N(6)/adenine(1519)-N(6))-dimethyltransferase RsmA [Corynebacterium pseudokroppenstedtii]|uniref:16S rRNA (adenine(1518)-N(6)/adenine(1519)-N(6))- dimethyltransferase RsmA n=1 Tax=Corynebacterium pseudokroppenstedtii TaxID=2804917 RepID=UPI00254E0DAF|nr:16S rRNA (adenine(1518)-N(6)/adenine(1519)-N(6))-dimethyltransferase RsmA [Corynebacterium pseudokroppenstedtii]MDK7147870.1 16S rRNA (adenine(1518)-N(6)/adenine(1519)-N(6))-dimethyltransferase RsmA [Corynebacterium pseudokroppenstedtii]